MAEQTIIERAKETLDEGKDKAIAEAKDRAIAMKDSAIADAKAQAIAAKDEAITEGKQAVVSGLKDAAKNSLATYKANKALGIPAFTAPKGGDFSAFSEFAAKKKSALEGNKLSMDNLSKISPSSILMGFTHGSIATNVWDKIKTGPLKQLGKDYITEQIKKNGEQILTNVATKFIPFDKIKGKILAPLIKSSQLVFDAITMAMTAKNEVMMLFVQQTAIQARDSIIKKREILMLLQEKIRLLNNALELLIAGDPYFKEYGAQLRQALLILWDASNDLRVVKNTLESRNNFLDQRFNQAIASMEKAQKLISPDDKHDPEIKFTDKGLLSKVGIPSKPQQLALILAVPLLVQETLAAARGYFQATIKVNAFLMAFQASYGQLEQTMSNLTVNYAINRISEVKTSLDKLINEMSVALNGKENELYPNPGFKPNPVATSAKSLGWNLALMTIIEIAKLAPVSGLKKLDKSNLAVQKYYIVADKLKKFGTVRSGQAILVATEAREDYGQLEKQLSMFCIKALSAIADKKTSKEIGALGTTIYNRLGLSIQQDKEIETALNIFINADLGFTDDLKKLQSGINGTLKSMGMDRAADKLNSGAFGEFFNMNAKTATYAGAAIVGIQTLMSCTSTTEQMSILEKATRMIQADQRKQNILLQRSVSNSYSTQTREIESQQKAITMLEDKANQAAKSVKSDSGCKIPDDMNPLKKFDSIFAAMGVNVLGSSTISAKMKSLGKGII